MHPHEHIYHFFFFEEPMGSDNGPREAWAHMGWVGHPAHYRSRFIFFYSWSHVHSPSARYRLQCTTLWVVHMCTPKGCTLYNARARVREAPKGQFRPFYSRFRPKLAAPFLAKIIFVVGSFGPQCTACIWVPLSGHPFFKKFINLILAVLK